MEKEEKHPVLATRLSTGQRAADKLTAFVGSWTFIISLLVFLGLWVTSNILILIENWDPYPFILLNLVVGCLTAIQAPVILMSQNRAYQRDRKSLEYDYQINKKAEREIEQIQVQLKEIKKMIK